MSDYYGAATLEDWLSEEVFSRHPSNCVNNDVVELFEKWRDGIESNIESWMDSDDGDGNRLSWRGWGRGFYGVPDGDEKELEAAIEKAKQYMKERR